MEEQLSLKNLIRQYLEIAWRRKWCAAPFPFFAAIAIYYALSLPPVYQSEGVLLVEDQNIPQELVRTTVTSYAAQQMQVIRRQIESSDNLLSVIKKYDLYDAGQDVDPAVLAQRFRDNMQVGTINVNVLDPEAGRQRVISIAFRISFQHGSPELAQKVAEELVQLFLEKNTLTRTQEAEETSTFLREEADNVRERVEEMEGKIAIFKSNNADSLPELLEYNLETITSSENRLRDNQVSIDNLTEQEQLLAIELRSMDPLTGAPVGSAVDTNTMSPSALLARRRTELAQLSTRYSDSHPTIKGLKRDIENLEIQMEADDLSVSSDVEDEARLSPVYLNLRYRVGSIERDIASLVQENEALRKQIEDYNARVERTYLVEREFEELQREYLAASERYDQLRRAQYEAEVAQSLEEKSQVEGLTVIERPVVPRFPIGPERPKIALMGIGLSGAICICFALLLEFMDERVRGLRSLEGILGRAPLAIVPVIKTSEELHGVRKRNKRILRYSLLSLTIVLLGIFLFVQLLLTDTAL